MCIYNYIFAHHDFLSMTICKYVHLHTMQLHSSFYKRLYLYIVFIMSSFSKIFKNNTIYLCSFSSIESTIRKLTKEMKKYIGALVNLDRADQRLSMNLISCGLTQSNDEYRRIVEEYFSVATQVS